MNYNITEQSGAIIAYYEFKRDNLLIFFNVVIEFEDRKNEFGIEFMNTTINICKVLNNRRYSPLYGLLYGALQEKIPTLPKKCPIKKVTPEQNALLVFVSFFFFEFFFSQQVLVVPLSSFETDKMPPVWPENAIRFTCRQYLFGEGILKPIMNLTLIYKLQRK